MFADSVAFPRKKVLEELTLLAKDRAAVGGDSIGVGAAINLQLLLSSLSPTYHLVATKERNQPCPVRACSATFAFSCSCAKATL